MTTEQIIAQVNPDCGMDISVALQPDSYFVAIDRNNYDVDCDHTGFFTRSPTGYGRTPLDAIVDLLDKTE
jgi:hypothetical protein